MLVAALVLLAAPTWSLVAALRAPGTDSTAARLAEWGRGHGLGWAVTSMERLQYDAHPPAVGGTLRHGIPTVAVGGSSASRAGPPRTRLDRMPAPIAPQARPPIAGEGSWRTLYRVHGQPAARVAFLRPDSAHTSYVAGVVWMDPHLLSFDLHPGFAVPGPVPGALSRIPAAQRTSVLATFNSGFKMVDARGGYWQNGTTMRSLRRGAASMVLTRTGGLDVRAWQGGTPAGNLAAVRQNLDLLVDHGRPTPAAADPSSSAWGATVGNRAFVWRSAIGVRPDGSVIFVVGPALSVQTLADLASAAGAVRAMELDINQDWTSYLLYHHGSNGTVTPTKLTPDEVPNPYRYLTDSSRDFVSVLPR